jgi:hypothetical protein
VSRTHLWVHTCRRGTCATPIAVPVCNTICALRSGNSSDLMLNLYAALLCTHCCCLFQTDCADPLNSMYYMVIVQYTARLNPKKLLQSISTLKPESERPPRKRYHFTLAPEQVKFASYNGVQLTLCVHSTALYNSSLS